MIKIIQNLIASSPINFLVISVAFFFAWSNLILEFGSELPFLLLISGGLIIPFLLLFGAIKYKNQTSYSITLSIFIFSVLIELSQLPGNIQMYLSGNEYYSSMIPEYEIEKILKLVFIYGIAIYLMSREMILGLFNWRITRTVNIFLIIFSVIIVLELLRRYL